MRTLYMLTSSDLLTCNPFFLVDVLDLPGSGSVKTVHRPEGFVVQKNELGELEVEVGASWNRKVGAKYQPVDCELTSGIKRNLVLKIQKKCLKDGKVWSIEEKKLMKF